MKIIKLIDIISTGAVLYFSGQVYLSLREMLTTALDVDIVDIAVLRFFLEITAADLWKSLVWLILVIVLLLIDFVIILKKKNS